MPALASHTILVCCVSIVAGAELRLSGAGSGVSFDGDARITATCVARPASWIWHAPSSLSPAGFGTNITVGLYNVPATCAASAWHEPCAGGHPARPPRFSCAWIGDAGNISFGPIAATRELDELGGVSLGVSVVLHCPSPVGMDDFQSLFATAFDGSSMSARLAVSHGNAEVPFDGEPRTDAVLFTGLAYPPKSPPPAYPPQLPPAAPPAPPGVPPAPDYDCSTALYNFSFTGSVQNFQVPVGAQTNCLTIGFIVKGGAGGGGSGGRGAQVTGWYRMSALSSQTLRVYVANTGENAYGGGASAVTSDACGRGDKSCIYVVAGGGGGSSSGAGGDSGENGAPGSDGGGGHGGGGASASSAGGGGGGQRRSGGAGSGSQGGAGSSACGLIGTGGGAWGWANGGKDNGACGDGPGGSGGAGWFGGGGGGGAAGGAGGGGGSSMLSNPGSVGGGYGTQSVRAQGAVEIKFCSGLTSC